MWFLLCAVQSRHHGFFDLRFGSKNLFSQVYITLIFQWLNLLIFLGFGQKVMGTGHFIALRPFFNFPEVAIHEKHRVSPRRFHWTSHMMMGWTYRLWQGYGLFVFASWQMERRCFLPSSLPIGIETDCARMHMSRKKGLFGYGHWGFQWGKHLINLIWRHQPLSKRMEWI